MGAVEALRVPYSTAGICAGSGEQGPSRVHGHGKDGPSVALPGAHRGVGADIPALLLQTSRGAVQPLS